jgi:hypothetical protein
LSSTEDRLREIARANGICWTEARRWMRDVDVEAAQAYLDSEDPRDRAGVVHWLRLLADPAIPKFKPDEIPCSARRPN